MALPEAFACQHCGAAILLPAVQPGSSVECPSCGNPNILSPAFLQKLENGIGARTMADVTAQFQNRRTGQIPVGGGSPPASGAPAGGMGGRSGSGGLAGRSSGLQATPPQGQPRMSLNAPPPPATQPDPGAPGFGPPQAPGFGGSQPTAPGYGAPPPTTPDLPASQPGFGGGPPYGSTAPGTMPGGHSFAAPETPSAPGGYGPGGPGATGGPTGAHNYSGGPPGGLGAALPPISTGSRGLAKERRTAWQANVIENEATQAEEGGRRLALLTCGLFAGAGLICVLGMNIQALRMFLLLDLKPSNTLTGTSSLAGGFTGRQLGMGEAGIYIVAGLAVASLAAAWFAQRQIRGWILLGLGLYPFIDLFIKIGPDTIAAEPLLISTLLIPPLMMFVYGGCAASWQMGDADWVRDRTAIAGLSMAGLVFFTLMGFQDTLPTVAAVGASMTFAWIAFVLSAPGIIAAYNHFAKSDAVAKWVLAVYWAGYCGIAAFFGLMEGGLMGLLENFAIMTLFFGWIFVAGCGFRDVIVERDLAVRRARVSREMHAAMAGDGGGQPDFGGPDGGIYDAPGLVGPGQSAEQPSHHQQPWQQ